MAKAPAAPKPSTSLLPLPDAVLKHHGEIIFKAMEQWQEQKRVPPVLLLSGPSGVGKRSILHYLSQWLLCEKSGFSGEKVDQQESLFGGGLLPEPAATPAVETRGEARPCGECGSCQRALHGNWVDFTEISAETGEGETGSLKIEQFRKLKSTMGFGAFDGAFRITLVRDADRMTVQAANSLLKLLEEPPQGWIFFLTASDPSLLLPTMLSRCQSLRLRPFSPESLVELLALAEVPQDRRAICARLANGSWGKALRMAEDEVWERRSSILRFFENPGAELGGLVDWASQEPANLELLLDQLEQVTADLMRWSLSDSPGQFAWTNLDGKKVLATHATTVTQRYGSPQAARRFWTSRAERIFRARQESLAPLNKKLLIQEVLLPWIETG